MAVQDVRDGLDTDCHRSIAGHDAGPVVHIRPLITF